MLFRLYQKPRKKITENHLHPRALNNWGREERQITTYPLGNKQHYESRANSIFQYGSADFHLSILSQDYLLYSQSKQALNKNIIAKKSKYTHISFVLTGKQMEIQES